MIQNINIARVSLITHGSLSALRTLDGVYIPRDFPWWLVVGRAGYRRIARGETTTERTSERAEQEGEGEKEESREAGRERRGSGNACVFVLLKAQGPALGRVGAPLWQSSATGLPRGRSGRCRARSPPPAMAEAAANAKFTLGKLPLPFVGPIMPRHNSSKIL